MSESPTIAAPSASGTLDEPIRDTVMRDIHMVVRKFKYVLFPTSGDTSQAGLSKEWDLWGPFILCLVLSVILSLQAPEEFGGYVFALVFVLVCLGSGIVTVNAILLRGKLSVFQSLCVLGYCMLPLVIAAVASIVIESISPNDLITSVLKSMVVSGGIVWGSRASIGFMSEFLPPERRLLAIYPVILLFVAIGWVILVS
jgi:hypothetical protein